MKQRTSIPPLHAQRLLKRLLRNELAEEVLGDLEEKFLADLKSTSVLKAKLSYWIQTLNYLRPFALRKRKPTRNHMSMFQNYYRVGIRNLLRNKVFSIINVSGLAIGIACCVLLALFIQDELSFEKNFADYKYIYRVTSTLKSATNETRLQRTSPVIGPTMLREFPDLENVTRVVKDLGAPHQVLTYQDRAFAQTRAYQVDSTFFEIFPYEFKEGNRTTALKEPWSVVLSEELAHKIFGDKPALNELLAIPTYSDSALLRVTGVVKQTQSHSHLDADFYFSGLEQLLEPITTWATSNFTFTYVKVKPDADVDQLLAKFPALMAKHGDEENRAMGRQKILGLQPLQSIHLHSTHLDNLFELGTRGSITYVYLAAAIGFLILMLAAINFINLTTAKASQRAREIGVRKTVGAHRSNLILQFMGESIGIALLAMLLGCALVYLSLPYFNHLVQKNLFIGNHNFFFLIKSLTAITLVTGFIAGAYPALVISSFDAIKVLKDKHLQLGSSPTLRKGLIAFQFSISVILVSGILVVQHQLNYIQNKPLGFNVADKVMVPLRTTEASTEYSRLRETVKNISGVKAVTASSNAPSTPPVSDWSFYPTGKTEADAINHLIVSVDENYFKMLSVQQIAGRDFVFPADGRRAANVPQKAIVNQASLTKMGVPVDQAVGTQLKFSNSESLFEIIGVVEDFHQFSLHKQIEPMIFLASIDSAAFRQMVVAIDKMSAEDTIMKIQTAWKELVPDTPFEKEMLSESVGRQYESDRNMSALVLGSTLLAVIISCLGLYGLSAFLAEKRLKEIGVRKVLGAAVNQIVFMLMLEFLKTVAIALAIGIPISYFLMQQWLANFAYRDNPGAGLFLVAACLCTTVSLLTVLYESLKAAGSNPVNSLKSD
ncbi:MAG: ABC transporter permease [Cyclobacteriaceae bacterium]|nr:ABC transporter permease [Cyclobacteriaceae bacterium]